jgi:hypothetical protein
MKKKKVEPTQEELQASRLRYYTEEMNRKCELGLIPLNPTRSFTVGQRVILGAHAEVYVYEIMKDGLFYIVKAIQIKRDRDKPAADEFHCVAWHEILAYDVERNTNFAKEQRYFIRLLNSSIDSLLHMCYAGHAGVDFNVEYQRDHVWVLEDKVALIDSIFNHIEIGKFMFVQRHESTPGRYYEILDGKQRLTTLCEFYEGRFAYKGVFYQDLSYMDRYRFTSHPITYGFLENPDKRGIYETFIKMNTCGRPMDHKHIDKVQKLLNELE